MKIIKIITAVLTVHALAIALLLVQPGCKTIEVHPRDEARALPVESVDNTDKPHSPLAENSSNPAIVKPEASAKTKVSSTYRHVPTRPTWNLNNNKETLEPKNIEVLEPLTPVAEVGLNALMENPKLDEPASVDYIVKSGDSLWVIAKKHDVSLNDLMELNDLNKKSILRVGQKIQIPGTSAAGMPEINPKNHIATAEGMQYKVRKGDSLSKIAQRFNISVDAIKQANHIKGSAIFAGKELILPGVNGSAQPSVVAKTVSAPKPSINLENAEMHTVQSGETLSDIASFYGVSVAKVQELNGITDPRKLRAGKVLVVSETKRPASITPEVNTQHAIAVKHSTEQDAVMSEFEFEEEFQDFDDSLFDMDEEIPVIPVENIEG